MATRATPTSQSASGAASTTTRTPSTSSASWTSWPTAAGKDPLEFRRPLMAQQPQEPGRPGTRSPASAPAGARPTPPGVYRGLCQNNGFGSYTAAVAEVSVSDKGELKILKHHRRHRSGLRRQPGPGRPPRSKARSFTGWAALLFYSENTIENGRVAESNFDTYQRGMRLDEMPKVETVRTAPSGGFWGGVGEPTIAVAAPAVLNAIFAATGKTHPPACRSRTRTCASA